MYDIDVSVEIVPFASLPTPHIPEANLMEISRIWAHPPPRSRQKYVYKKGKKEKENERRIAATSPTNSYSP